MNTQKKILVIGGTGAMGTYLVPELSKLNYKVDVVSLDDVISDDSNVTYYKEDAKNLNNLKKLLQNNYDAIVDFMIYLNVVEFTKTYKLMLENTKHYIYLSSYRVYDYSPITTENSPRLLDSSEDAEFLAHNDYSLYKAAEENILSGSKYDNWTIIRPAITYSKRRFQLTTLEAPLFVPRALNGKIVVLPQGCLDKQATMTWGGDVAKMIARLIFNPKAYKEAFSVTTDEHHSWREIAEYYKDLIGLKYVSVPDDIYLKIFGSNKNSLYQLKYDRCFDRIMDNSKILNVTGLKQSELMTLKKGLEKELSALPKDLNWGCEELNINMDNILNDLQLN